ncbi:MAG: alpha/beta fold hydrolase [Oscillospiraceae bacterium]|nr:alpha/beta fold hydrolase [Oscillospiraceae bacterium]
MKKLISLVLSLVLIFALAAPALAAEVDNIPIILIRGDGAEIYSTEDGKSTKVWPIEFGDDEDKDSKIKESVINITSALLIDAVALGDWDKYYKTFGEEIAPLFDGVRMDTNGNPRNNTGIHPNNIWANTYNATRNYIRSDGSYSVYSYTYNYDWRLDPYDVIDDLHEYIKGVLKATGKKQVALAGHCLGGSFVLAYLEKYADEGLVKRVFFNATVGNGTDLLTDVYCGDIQIDPVAIERFGAEYLDFDSESFGGLFDIGPFINEIIYTSFDLLYKVGVFDAVGVPVSKFYAKIYEGLVPELTIATYSTMPGYWTIILPERFEEAVNFVFGPEGSEKRTEYAGLVEKLYNYYNKVSSRKEEILDHCEELGIDFGATAKYGMQMMPFVASQSELADELVDLEHASFGATVAKDVFSTLDEAYIAAQTAKGLNPYISPDKQVDASTSRFKDQIWFIKNLSHYDFAIDFDIMQQFCSFSNYEVTSDSRYPQYMILLPDTAPLDEDGNPDYSEAQIVPMTEENCHETIWQEVPEDSKEEEADLGSKLMALFRWLTTIFTFLLSLFK